MTETVLVVDDDATIRELLRRWLSGWGYVVNVAASATEGLERMMAAPASIMLVDIGMPGHDGFWLIEHARSSWPRTRFIMATGAADLDMVRQGKRAGAVDYVLKPFGRELLRQALARAEAVEAKS